MKKISRKVSSHDFCMVPPHPELRKKLVLEYKRLKKRDKNLTPVEFLISKGLYRRRILGLDDSWRPETMRAASNATENVTISTDVERINLPSFRPKGDVNVLFLLVDFSDKPHTETVEHYTELLFSENNTSYTDKSLKEYYREVSYGGVNIVGHVSDWYRMPQPYSYYTVDDGLGAYPRNAQRMVEDALDIAKQQGGVDWDKFDVNKDGMIEALSVVHAGRGAEQTGPGSGNIWSHKYITTKKVNLTNNTFASTYLTVPEDAKLGVIAHEMGHLLFGWPDLYDAQPRGTRVTEGLGDWCLMASGSWNNNGVTPSYPCGWCRHVQGWTNTVNITSKQKLDVKNIEENKEVYRVWTKGRASSEYFMMENRQKVGFDSKLPGTGIIIYHIDETMPNNWDEDHLAVGVMQADGRRDLQEGGFFRNQGDASDPYPGTTRNRKFGSNTKPNSKSYAGQNTGVTVVLSNKESSKAMKVLVAVG